MGVSNLVVMATVVVFYGFIVWGISGLYDVPGGYEIELGDDYSTSSNVSENIFGIGVYQDDRIPPIINLLVITPLNFLLVGCVFYFLRSGAS